MCFFQILFAFRYIWAGLIVVLGIYLNIFSKRNKMTTRELFTKLQEMFTNLPYKMYHNKIMSHKKDSMFDV